MKVLSATAAHVTIERMDVTTVRVLDENTGNRIGLATKVHGFIHYQGANGSAHEGMYAIIRSTDSTYVALERALRDGLKNGRDDSAS